MLEFLASVWDRVYTFFISLYWNAWYTLSYHWSRLFDYLANKYPNLASLAGGLYSDLQWYVYTFRYWARTIVDWLGYSLSTFVNYYYLKVITFFGNEYFKILSFLNYDLPTLKNFITQYAYNIYLLCVYYFNNIVFIARDAIYSLRDYVTDKAQKLNYFLFYELPKLALLLSANILGTFKTIQDNYSKLLWLFDPKTIPSLISLLTSPQQVVTTLISDLILRPLSLWLTKLWFPHEPIDGE